MTDPDPHGDADLAPGQDQAGPCTAVRAPATSGALAVDPAAILDSGTPAFQDLPRLPEELR